MIQNLTLREFLRPPTKLEWYSEIFDHGWRGSDGSSCSPDHICGCTIGVTSAHHAYSMLPANLHDWRYQRIRRLGLPEVYRKAADLGYYVDCLAATAWLDGWAGWKARTICKFRYHVLRTVAAYAAVGPLHKLEFAWRRRGKSARDMAYDHVQDHRGSAPARMRWSREGVPGDVPDDGVGREAEAEWIEEAVGCAVEQEGGDRE